MVLYDAMGNNVRLSESPSYSVSSDGLTMPRSMGNPPCVSGWHYGRRSDGSGSKNEEVVSAEK